MRLRVPTSTVPRFHRQPPRARQLVTAALAALCSVVVAACGEDEPELGVTVCGNVPIPDIAAFRVEVLDEDRRPYSGAVFELYSCEPEEIFRGLPQTVTMSAPAETVWVRVDLLRSGGFVKAGSKEVRTTLKEGETRQVRLSFTDDCIGVECEAGQTCHEGECVVVEFGDVSECVASPEVDVELCPQPGESGLVDSGEAVQ